MKLHRNSQKRIYFKDAVYFITCKTHSNYPYFRERIFCDLFVENLRICRRLKGFSLYGWVLNFDHFHLLVRPSDEFNISKIMKSLKENVSCDVNRILFPEGATPASRLQIPASRLQIPASRLQVIYENKFDISDYKIRFKQQYPHKHPFPKFLWQKSFFDHYVRNDSDFAYHMDYIAYNPEKHGLPANWPYVYTNTQYEDMIDE
jgi:REP element-mobilizing transposase RayT